MRGEEKRPSAGNVEGNEAKVWVDASSLASGVAVEIGGHIVEDASWLRKKDSCHINLDELDAAIKGLNLALAWQVKKLELTDSSTVHRWITGGLSGKTRLKTKAASEMLIRRRVRIVLSLVEECGLQLKVSLVPTCNNKADSLTRVSQRWLKPVAYPPAIQSACAAGAGITDGIAKIHDSVSVHRPATSEVTEGTSGRERSLAESRNGHHCAVDDHT